MNRKLITSLIDIDLYKLLMLQYIWKYHGKRTATMGFSNRSHGIKLANQIDLGELDRQLGYCCDLVLDEEELQYLISLGYFKDDFIQWLSTFKLGRCWDLAATTDGQISLTFSGEWASVTLWEIYALAIINEMRSNFLSEKVPSRWRLVDSMQTAVISEINKLPMTDVIEFGTRRRFSKAFQKGALYSGRYYSRIKGTSNVLLASQFGIGAVGTIAHEIPMAETALNPSINSQYEYLGKWDELYEGRLRTMLPDTFTSDAFFNNAPSWLAKWDAIRVDSKDPVEGGKQCIEWWTKHGENPKMKRVIFSDGLTADSILQLWKEFSDTCGVSFGWGTNLTNNAHSVSEIFKPMSSVIKLKSIDGLPTVKLSDNLAKATGPESEIERYKEIFGVSGQKLTPLVV